MNQSRLTAYHCSLYGIRALKEFFSFPILFRVIPCATPRRHHGSHACLFARYHQRHSGDPTPCQDSFSNQVGTTNFSIWRQVRSTLIGLDLLGYIDGTMAAPPMILAESANPCYSIWFRQDQSIVGALFGSCSDQVQPLISNADTSHAAWTSLHSAFESANRGRVDMQSLANELALIQCPISEEDLVCHVLNQVGDEYDSITSAALLCPTSIPFTELQDVLKEHE
ncbi:hypothetical protein DM860_001424 [Cuscuta australis]|uniref:Retrotransposon Copia-like N-terminal domain-containing protein n=1 Tax=Cuscuta australis TaxID=267555 RepID=A0A328EAB8_9ASTE|nr:hypothetical protein DM860_001424 [Cuscuta australis]